MKSHALTAAALFAVLALAGCKEPKATAATLATSHRNWVSIPALPIIQESVLALKPVLGGKNEPALMAQICGLARGDLTQAQVSAFLDQHHIAADKLPQGSAQALLVNGDKAGQATACAAYLASGVLSAVKAEEFMAWVKPAPVKSALVTKKSNDKSKGKSKGKPEAAPVPARAAKPELRIDQDRLATLLPIKLAVARANADVFALIATELQRRPGLSIGEYLQQVAQLFARLAPVYLQRVKLQMPAPSTRYQLLRADAGRFAFSSSVGSSFEFGDDGLVLRQNGILWYGQGNLLGQQYPLQVAYFDTAMDALLAPTKP